MKKFLPQSRFQISIQKSNVILQVIYFIFLGGGRVGEGGDFSETQWQSLKKRSWKVSLLLVYVKRNNRYIDFDRD